MNELFIFGNPRLLSGGQRSATEINYDSAPPRIGAGAPVVDEKRVAECMKANPGAGYDAFSAVTLLKQAVHSGKRSYHSRPTLNVFMEPGANPTVGVELETLERRGVSDAALVEDLKSNWFHFEHDGSLADGSGRDGYELITEPLTPRYYRDLRLWTGLQNILTPWVESFGCPQTGLHVHVGLEQFSNCDDMPFPGHADRRRLGKYMTAYLFLHILDRGFSDRVFLRKNTHYCAAPTEAAASVKFARNGSGRKFMNDVASLMTSSSPSAWGSAVAAIASNVRDGRSPCKSDSGARYEFTDDGGHGMTGHTTEVNCSHPFTVEFRRGKGTLHALSVHRMVEFTALLVKYAEEIARRPDDTVVSNESVLDYMITNTTSSALRELAITTKGTNKCA